MQNENDKGQRSHTVSIDHEKVLGRILALSDGVFAFAITLLILNLAIPDNTNTMELPTALIALWPKYLAFLISFFVIGLFWFKHVRQFRVIKRYNSQLLWLNLFFLLFIVIIPFSTNVLSSYQGSLPVILYAAVLVCAGLMDALIYIYATHKHRLVDENLGHADIRRGIILSLIAPVIFALSIGIAFIDTSIAQYSWISIFVIHVIAQRVF